MSLLVRPCAFTADWHVASGESYEQACVQRRRRRTKADTQASAARKAARTITIAMIAKSSDEPRVPRRAHGRRGGGEGALGEDAAWTVEVDVAHAAAGRRQVQAQRIQQAVNDGADAILISCSDAGKVTGAINDAVDRGVPVMTFDSDAPQSKRFAYYGVDDVEDRPHDDGGAREADGRQGQGRDPRRQPERAEPAEPRAGREGGGGEVSRHPDRRHVQPHRDAAGRRRPKSCASNNAYPGDHGLGDDRRMAAVHAVAARPISNPNAHEDRVGRRVARAARRTSRRASSPVLLAQPVYQWGYIGVQHDRRQGSLEEGRRRPIIPMELVRVSKENLGEWARQLRDVGIHRRRPTRTSRCARRPGRAVTPTAGAPSQP